jgi:hypothetical protein
MVYKYFHPDRSSFFADPHLSFSPPSLLNDPPECTPQIEIRNINQHIDNIVQRNFARALAMFGNTAATRARIKIARNKMIASYRSKPDLIRSMVLDKVRKNVNDTIGILALSKDPDNELLWAYYSSSHEGFVVGFDDSHDFFKRRSNDPADCGFLRDVAYVNKRIKIRIDNIKIPLDLFFTKKTKWSREREVRMIRPLANADTQITVRGRTIFLFKVPQAAIKEVIFGTNCTPKTIGDLQSDIARDPLLTGISQKKADFDLNGNMRLSPYP